MKYSFPVLFVLFYLLSSQLVTAETRNYGNNYFLALSFDLKNNQLNGTARITLKPGPDFFLSVARLNITGTLLKNRNGNEMRLTPVGDKIIVPASDTPREIYISYTKKTAGSYENIIDPKGISLVNNWHPVPSVPMKFTIEATLPKNFMAITETDHFPLQRTNNRVKATFSHKVYSINFTAGPYFHKKRKVREGLFVHSLFFAEEKHLASGYLEAAAVFIQRYEKEIGPYPYNHYVITANRLPTGFGMPGYTLIGQMVLRLPFIKETSLGHEILHSWFGSSVGVDYTEGNWCEGLTSYLADHSYRNEKGEGIQDKKAAITHYLSYNNREAVIPLSEFTSASHSQTLARARRAVGYTRGALLFHELKEKIGEQPFKQGIRLFYQENVGKKATWTNLRESFETSSGTRLKVFFEERLHSLEIPSLSIQDIEIHSVKNRPVLTFSLIQDTQKPFSLLVPIQIKGNSGTTTHERFIEEHDSRISIELDTHPLEIILDPEYSFLRTLSQPERPAVWSGFLGDSKKLVIIGSDKERKSFDSLLQALSTEEMTVKNADQVSNQELSENSILFLGADQPHALSLFGGSDHRADGFTLDVRTNPLNPKHTAVLVSSSDKMEADMAANRLSHYGKYSLLHFLHGRNMKKKTSSSQSGIRIVLETLPEGGRTADISTFDAIINELNKSRVIYIGETHTSFADHRLQLQIIEALHAKKSNLVIGMEMFPASSQPALDRYLQTDTETDERTFLKESEYFKVWSYDYRFFRNIINFAKANNVPVRGLNLDKEIVSEVFRSGSTDNLEKTTLHSLPKERNLDMNGYSERLAAMHDIHIQGGHGSGNAGGFIQAQGLWDESMAENIANYLKTHPGQKMIVLAGSQHTRKDSGIPPRVKRRIDVEQSSVLNIGGSSDRTNLKKVADYFFISAPGELPKSPKIGIVLATATKDNRNFLKISQISPHGKAGEAGLQVSDILTKINGFLIDEMSDLRIAMIDAQEGETVMVTILRGDGNVQKEITVKVKLSLPPSQMLRP